MNRLSLSVLITVTAVTGCVGPESLLERSYQREADKKRVQGALSYSSPIETFHEKNGYYPLTKDASRLPVTLVVFSVYSGATIHQLGSTLVLRRQ